MNVKNNNNYNKNSSNDKISNEDRRASVAEVRINHLIAERVI